MDFSLLQYIITRYIQEFLEAFIAYSLVNYMKNNTFDVYTNVSMGISIGLITLVLEEYNRDYSKSVKNGMLIGLVGKIFK